MAISEFLSEEKRFNVAQSATFRFYVSTLQYCLVNEYCKLAQTKNASRQEQNVSSIDALLHFHGNELNQIHGFDLEKWNIRVKKFLEFDISSRLRSLRDSKFSHIDARSPAMSIKGFNGEDLRLVLKALEVPHGLYNELSQTELLLDRHVLTNTDQFIKNLNGRSRFYFENFQLAKEAGF